MDKASSRGGPSAYEKEALACEAELERVQARLKEMRRLGRYNSFSDRELRTYIMLYEDLAVELKAKIKEFRRRAKGETT